MSVVWKTSRKMGQNNSYERLNQKPQSQYYRSSQPLPRNSTVNSNNTSWGSKSADNLIKKENKTLQSYTNKGFDKK